MKVLTADEKVENARLDLVMNMPYYGSVFLRLDVFEDDDCPTAWTDGNSIGYSLDYCATLTHEQIIGLFVHECLHVIFKHHLRKLENPDFEKQHTRFNHAADYSLNPVIKRSSGMNLHEDWLYDSKWDDETCDVIFYQLPESKDDPCYDNADEQPGEVRPWPGDPNDPKSGKGKPSPAEVEQESQKVDRWVKAAAFKAQGVGKMDGNVEQVIKKATATVTDWTEYLRLTCEAVTKNDYTWQRPNPRYMQFGTYLPSMSGTKSEDMVFFVDTSGSVNDTQLGQTAREIQEIVSEFNIRVVVVYWDTGFRDMEVFEPGDVLDPEFNLSVKGRGGTNFSNCWDWLQENQDDFDINPKAMIFFSDMECSKYPEDYPGMPVIWAQLPAYRNQFITSYLSHLPDYGEHVRVPIYKEG